MSRKDWPECHGHCVPRLRRVSLMCDIGSQYGSEDIDYLSARLQIALQAVNNGVTTAKRITPPAHGGC